MSGSERRLGIIKDILLSVDAHTRYDLYFTDRRVAIVCMGKTGRYESTQGQMGFVPSAFGVPPPVDSYVEKTPKTQAIEDEIRDWSIDDLLRLSKKSCFYTYEEIQEVKLIIGRHLKFTILSEDCESKFSPNQEQLAQLIEILPTIDALRNKFSIAGKWSVLQEIFRGQFSRENRATASLSGRPADSLH